MAGRNWVDDILSECEHVETPRSWIYWSMLAAISAAAANNYYLVAFKGAVIYKPNLYVILMGESGLGKEFPINLANRLVNAADVTRVIAGRSSIQAVVKELSQARTREKKGPIEDSRGFIVNGELSTAIISDPDSLTILTDLYDNKQEWTNLLKGDGKEKLKKPYITTLFGSSPAHFYDKVPQVNIEGGYIGRNLIIREEKRYQDTDLFSEDETTISFPFEKYSIHLESIASKAARILPSLEAKVFLNAWRRDWRKNQPADKTGFINRVPDHSLKVAMLLNLAEYEPTYVITLEQMTKAIESVVALAYTTKQTAEGTGKDPLAMQTKMVLDALISAPENRLFRRQLLSKGYGNYDSIALDRIMDYLSDAGWVEKFRHTAGAASDWIYELKGEPLANYQKFLTDRSKGK